MMDCKISEKALEMNVCENFVRIARNYSSKAYIYGYSTRMEAYHGLDSSINMPGHMYVVSFQFKRPRRKSGTIYRFIINEKGKLQLLKVVMFALCVKELLHKDPHIYYALPCICDADELEDTSPDFVNRTFFISALDLVRFADLNQHEVIVYTHSQEYEVHSERKYVGKVLNFEMLLRKISEDLKAQRLPTAKELKELHVSADKLKEVLLTNGVPEQGIEALFRELSERGKRKVVTYFRALAL